MPIPLTLEAESGSTMPLQQYGFALPNSQSSTAMCIAHPVSDTQCNGNDAGFKAIAVLKSLLDRHECCAEPRQPAFGRSPALKA